MHLRCFIPLQYARVQLVLVIVAVEDLRIVVEGVLEPLGEECLGFEWLLYRALAIWNVSVVQVKGHLFGAEVRQELVDLKIVASLNCVNVATWLQPSCREVDWPFVILTLQRVKSYFVLASKLRFIAAQNLHKNFVPVLLVVLLSPLL